MKLDEVIRKYIDGTYKSLGEAATLNGYTIDQINYFVKKISKSDDISMLKLYKEYIIEADKRKKEARVKGGKNGKRTTSHTLDEIYSWYHLIVDSDLTLEEVELRTNIPRTVIHENLDKYLTVEEKEKLKAAYIKHKSFKKNYQNDIERFPERISSEVVVTQPGRRGKR